MSKYGLMVGICMCGGLAADWAASPHPLREGDMVGTHFDHDPTNKQMLKAKSLCVAAKRESAAVLLYEKR